MSYQALARKYRPQSFSDVIGQETVVRTLQNAIEGQRIHHAYLFSGVRGVGKTTAARILAKALNCVKGPTAEPCNECTICREITEGIDMDVREIDAATYTGVDNIRELRDTTQFQPARDRNRIFIIDEDAVAVARRLKLRCVAQLADVVDARVGRGIDLAHIHVDAFGDLAADRALVARLGGWTFDAVQRFRQDARRSRLANAANA